MIPLAHVRQQHYNTYMKNTLTPPTQTSALERQVGGAHYKNLKIQPVEYIHANGLGYFEGNVVKYTTRWRDKGGVADLEKAKHYIELLIDLEARKLPEVPTIG